VEIEPIFENEIQLLKLVKEILKKS